MTQLSPSELSVSPIRADALIVLVSEQVVLHLEFQTQPDATIPFCMADYRLRVYRRYPKKQMRQVVIYSTFQVHEVQIVFVKASRSAALTKTTVFYSSAKRCISNLLSQS